MKHFTAEELVAVLTKIRRGVALTANESETLKLYLPLHLNSDRADKMAKLVEDIRNGKREPLSKKERIMMHQENMEQTLNNIIKQIPQMNDEQFTETCNMCEMLRSQIARH
ncbi:hypothetical protein V6C27_04100 [Peptococcaceae bacterium 1198_IL3148]